MTSAVVFGYSEVGYRCLQVLLRQRVDIPLVFSHHDDPNEQQWYGSVVQLARSNGLEVATPEDPGAQPWISKLQSLRPDFIFSFYYRHMLADRVLASARRAALNMHGSLLPKYRGRAPVNWAVVHGESETGASLHAMQAKPDAGPLYGQQAVPILINDTALDVSLKLAGAAEQLLDRCWPDLEAGRIQPKPLDLARGSYYGRRRPEDGRIDWRQPVLTVHNLIRAVAPPFPGAFCIVGEQRLRFDGSLFRNEVAAHSLGPCLYVERGKFFADGSDGKRIEITGLAINGETIDASQFPAQFGTAPLIL